MAYGRDLLLLAVCMISAAVPVAGWGCAALSDSLRSRGAGGGAVVRLVVRA